MAFSITVRNKATRYSVGHGYSTRPYSPSAIVVHSTEGAVGQSLQSASDYLYHSADVSAHYLIGKNGEIIEFLLPSPYAAWHAGQAQTAFDNNHSVGIECLHAQSETWPAVQKDALAWLLVQLVSAFAVAVPMIDTHGQIALPGPYDRKRDPTNWNHVDFVAWRDALFAPVSQDYRFRWPQVVFTDRRADAPLAQGPVNGVTQYHAGDVVTIGDVTDGWGWINTGIGFVPMSVIEKI